MCPFHYVIYVFNISRDVGLVTVQNGIFLHGRKTFGSGIMLASLHFNDRYDPYLFDVLELA